MNQGGPGVCPICGLFYDRSVKQDNLTHKRYHDKFLEGIPLASVNEKYCFEEDGKTIIYVDEK